MLTHGELTADCRSARFTFPYSMSNLWCRPLMAGSTEHEQTELRYQFRCSDSVIFQHSSWELWSTLPVAEHRAGHTVALLWEVVTWRDWFEVVEVLVGLVLAGS